MPLAITAPASILFDGTDSIGTGLTYTWDLDGDGVYETEATAASRDFFQAGSYTVGLQATDGTYTDTAVLEIEVT